MVNARGKFGAAERAGRFRFELRSCERFKLLASYCRGREAAFARFYERLWSSERGHYHVFLMLAGLTLPRDQVDDRWREFLQIEADAIRAQAPGSRIHSGLPE